MVSNNAFRKDCCARRIIYSPAHWDVPAPRSIAIHMMDYPMKKTPS